MKTEVAGSEVKKIDPLQRLFNLSLNRREFLEAAAAAFFRASGNPSRHEANNNRPTTKQETTQVIEEPIGQEIMQEELPNAGLLVKRAGLEELHAIKNQENKDLAASNATERTVFFDTPVPTLEIGESREDEVLGYNADVYTMRYRDETFEVEAIGFGSNRYPLLHEAFNLGTDPTSFENRSIVKICFLPGTRKEYENNDYPCMTGYFLESISLDLDDPSSQQYLQRCMLPEEFYTKTPNELRPNIVRYVLNIELAIRNFAQAYNPTNLKNIGIYGGLNYINTFQPKDSPKLRNITSIYSNKDGEQYSAYALYNVDKNFPSQSGAIYNPIYYTSTEFFFQRQAAITAHEIRHVADHTISPGGIMYNGYLIRVKILESMAAWGEAAYSAANPFLRENAAEFFKRSYLLFKKNYENRFEFRSYAPTELLFALSKQSHILFNTTIDDPLFKEVWNNFDDQNRLTLDGAANLCLRYLYLQIELLSLCTEEDLLFGNADYTNLTYASDIELFLPIAYGQIKAEGQDIQTTKTKAIELAKQMANEAFLCRADEMEKAFVGSNDSFVYNFLHDEIAELFGINFSGNKENFGYTSIPLEENGTGTYYRPRDKAFLAQYPPVAEHDYKRQYPLYEVHILPEFAKGYQLEIESLVDNDQFHIVILNCVTSESLVLQNTGDIVKWLESDPNIAILVIDRNPNHQLEDVDPEAYPPTPIYRLKKTLKPIPTAPPTETPTPTPQPTKAPTPTATSTSTAEANQIYLPVITR
ncbi:hypothetical protein KA082_00050 [Candidatus Woesebacteria bacterium]|nr:hypothetical protein [Candidatus Woesebacteria bacterium]